MHFEIAPDIRRQLGARYEMRPLRLDDYEKGFLDCLSDLTVVGMITKAEFEGNCQIYAHVISLYCMAIVA
jgi:glucosamine-phosphate N-acetyltransferase